jgi:peptidoglycan hydrolase-like protein with peptidoglycan-binding domain
VEARQRTEAEAKSRAEAEAKAKADSKAKTDAEAAEKKVAEAAEMALHLAPLDRQRLQVALTSLGFDTRGSDGVFGPRSREMIVAYQKARNQPATSFLSAKQQQALLKEAAAAIGIYEDEQKKKIEEARQKAEEEAKVRAAGAAATTPAATPPATTAAPQAASPSASVAPSLPQGSSSDGSWFGAVSCRDAGRVSFQGTVAGGRGTLSGPDSSLTLVISGSSVAISVQIKGRVEGSFQGELRGRGVFAKGGATSPGGSDLCTVSLVGP